MNEYMRRGDLFNDRGKWKYTVALDYRQVDYDSWDLWSEAEKALELSTYSGTSGVVFHRVPDGWSLVVLEPCARNSHPITVRKRAGE